LKKKKYVFGLSKNLFREWFNFSEKSSSIKAEQQQFDDSLPFNKLEIGLFMQNCFLCMMADDQDNVRLEHLFSVAICIIVYFIIV